MQFPRNFEIITNLPNRSGQKIGGKKGAINTNLKVASGRAKFIGRWVGRRERDRKGWKIELEGG